MQRYLEMDRQDNFRDTPERVKYLTRKILSKQLRKRKKIFIFLDYDGTLSPIVKEPDLARMSLRTKNILKKLSRKKGFIVGVISGRSLKDIRKRVSLKTVVYAGNHGLELAYQGKKISHKLSSRQTAVFQQTKVKIKRALKNINGVIFEDKGIVFAAHYRKVAQKDQTKVINIFKHTVKPLLKQKLFKTGGGKKVLELKPVLSINKAQAISFFQQKFKKKKHDLTIFIGDDLTDEDVFQQLKPPDLGIRVGKKKASQAGYFLKNPKEVTVRLSDILHFS